MILAGVNVGIEKLKESLTQVIQMSLYRMATGIEKLHMISRKLLNKAWRESTVFVDIDEIQIYSIHNNVEPIKKAYEREIQTVTEAVLKAIDAGIYDGTVCPEIRDNANFAVFLSCYMAFFKDHG